MQVRTALNSRLHWQRNYNIWYLTFLRCVTLLYFAIRLESRKSANKRIYLSIYNLSSHDQLLIKYYIKQRCRYYTHKLAAGKKPDVSPPDWATSRVRLKSERPCTGLSVEPCHPSQRNRVLNAAARVVSNTRKFDRSLSQLLHDDLHWLDVPDRVAFKLIVTVHRCLNGRAPNYPLNHVIPVSAIVSRQRLRSAQQNTRSHVTDGPHTTVEHFLLRVPQRGTVFLSLTETRQSAMPASDGI